MHLPPENHKEKEYHNRIRKVLAFIQDNLTFDIKLETLSEIAAFSPFHFQKLFTQFVGETPKQYIIRLRLERVVYYLTLFPSVPISDLAFQSGFSSPSIFSRAFKNYFGISPEKFRSLSPDEIRKICKSKTNNSNLNDFYSSDFWDEKKLNEELKRWSNEFKFEVVKRSSLSLAFIDTHLGSEDSVTNAFKQLYQWASPRDLISNETRYIGIFLDIPFFTDFKKCRYRACITLSKEQPKIKDAGVTQLTEGKYVSCKVKGNIETSFISMIALKHLWLDESGYQLASLSGYEEYSEKPITKSCEKTVRTIYFPVKPA